ncbi:MAG: helix-turn-helix domain-containing protein [Alphaproteobacteria bacterium]
MFGSSFFDYVQPILSDAVADKGLDANWLADQFRGMEDLSEAARDRKLIDALGELSQAAHMPELGFILAREVPLTAFGTVSMGLPVAPTLGEALRLIKRYYRLISPTIIYDISHEDDHAVLVAAMDHPPGAGVDQLVCGGIQVINRYIESYTQNPTNYLSGELTTADQSIGQACQKHLGVVPELGAARNAFKFPAHILNMPSPTADPKTFEAIMKMCEDAEQSAGRPRNILAQVQEIVRAHVANPPDLAGLASRLEVSERQLRFALSRAGTSYQAIVRDARVANANLLLQNPDLPISTVAYRLGYNDPANFTTAFKRWTGQTPRAARTALTEKASP